MKLGEEKKTGYITTKRLSSARSFYSYFRENLQNNNLF